MKRFHTNLLFNRLFLIAVLSGCNLKDQVNSSLTKQDTGPYFKVAFLPAGLAQFSSVWPEDAIGLADAAMTSDGKIIVAGTINTGDPDDKQRTQWARLDSYGNTDMSFGKGGYIATEYNVSKQVTTAFGGKVTAGTEWITALALDPNDNSIYLAGIQDRTKWGALTPVPAGNQSFIFKLTPDGLPDPSFNGGKPINVVLDSGYTPQTHILDIAVQPDGKVVAVGYLWSDELPIGVKTKAFATRYNTDGSIDNGFGGDGVSMFDFDSSIAKFTTIYIQPSGHIVLAGQRAGMASVARLFSNGLLDTSFGSGGITTFNKLLSICDLQPQGDKFVVMATTAKGAPNVLVRINNDGTPDRSFGTADLGGDRVTMFENGTAAYGKCALLVDKSDNSIYIATNDQEPRINKFDSLGRIDESFPGFGPKGYFINGWPTVGISGYPDPAIPRSIFINKDGYFVVVGRVNTVADLTNPFVKQVYGYVNVMEKQVGTVERPGRR